MVQCNVRGRDVGSFVEEARDRIVDEVDLPAGYFVAFAGQFEHMERARLRLAIVVPIALALILFLLYTSTGSLRDALIIFTGAPFATLGGLLALWARDMPFTVSAGVGFVAVSGVAMLAGLVLVSTIRRLADGGMDLEAAHRGERARPAAADPDDDAGREPRVRPDGREHGSRSRGAAAARNRGRGGCHLGQRAHTRGIAGDLPGLWEEVEAPGLIPTSATTSRSSR